jgi:hypothetical protein
MSHKLAQAGAERRKTIREVRKVLKAEEGIGVKKR